MTETLRRLKAEGIEAKANVYFGGKVVSHTVFEKDSKKTVGVIFPGNFKFNTQAPETMTIVAGSCRVLFASGCQTTYEAGMKFHVPADSYFSISVDQGACEYICEYR